MAQIMADQKPPHLPAQDTPPDDVEEEPNSDLEDEEYDSDLEDGDEVIDRGYIRNEYNLEKHGFRPVWTCWNGYPHPCIPSDIFELLDEDGKSSAQVIGPLRSFAWLYGLDELIEAIDSDAYSIQDSIEVVPLGATLMWPVEKYINEGKIPSHIAEKAMGFPSAFTPAQGDMVRVQSRSPEGVTPQPSPFALRRITEANRLGGDSATVMCMKVQSIEDPEKLESQIQMHSDGLLTWKRSGKKLWYRGMSISELQSSLQCFTPQVESPNRDNEFGPGIYTTDSLQESLLYINHERGGAIMVFDRPGFEHFEAWEPPRSPKFKVWEPRGDAWAAYVARWTAPRLKIAEKPLPRDYELADFIEGAMSEDCSTGYLPTPSDKKQLVAVSPKGIEELGKSLYMIIFVDPR